MPLSLIHPPPLPSSPDNGCKLGPLLTHKGVFIEKGGMNPGSPEKLRGIKLKFSGNVDIDAEQNQTTMPMLVVKRAYQQYLQDG